MQECNISTWLKFSEATCAAVSNKYRPSWPPILSDIMCSHQKRPGTSPKPHGVFLPSRSKAAAVAFIRLKSDFGAYPQLRPWAAAAGWYGAGSAQGVNSGVHHHGRFAGAAAQPAVNVTQHIAIARRSFFHHAGIQSLIFQHQCHQIPQFRPGGVAVGLHAAFTVGIPVLIAAS